MCTPEDLKKLAVGHLWGRDAISFWHEIYVQGAFDEMRFISVSLADDLPEGLTLEGASIRPP